MGSKTTTATSSNAPWAPQGNALADGYLLARDNLTQEATGTRGQYYPGQTYTPMSSQTEQGVQSMFVRGQNGGLANGQAGEQATGAQAARLLDSGAYGVPGWATLSNAANGAYLNGGNPEFQGMVDRSIAAARPSVDSAFAGSGRLGSGAHAAAFSDAATRISGDLAYQNYGQERQMQQQAAATLGQSDLAARSLGGQLAGQATASDHQNIQSMLQSGDILEGYGDKALTDNVNRWNFDQNQTYDQIARYMGIVQGGGTTQGTMTQPITGGSRIGSAASGAMGGAAMGSSFGPYGAAIGGVAGGLLGAFS